MPLPKSGVQLVAQDLNSFVRDMGRAEAALQSFRKTASSAGTVATQFRLQGVEQASQQVRGLGSEFTGLRGIATGALLGIGQQLASLATRTISVGVETTVTQLGNAVNAAGELQNQITRIKIAPGVTQSAEELRKTLTDIALDPNLVISFEEAGVAGLALARNQGQVNEQFLRAATLLQNQAGLTDTTAEYQTAGETVARAARIFSLGNEEIIETANQIPVVIGSGFKSLIDYRFALANSGGIAASLGLTFKDFNSILALTADGFSSGRTTGTAFNAFLRTLVPNSDKAKDAFERLGLSFFTAEGQFIGINKAVDQLRNAFAGLSDEERIRGITEAFGVTAGGFVRELLAVSDAQREQTVTLIENADAATKAAEASDTLVRRLATVGDQAQALGASFAFPLLDQFTGGLESLGSSLQAIRPTFEEAGKSLAEFLAPFSSAAISGLETFAGFMERGASPVQAFGAALTSVNKPLGDLFNLIRVASGAQGFAAFGELFAGRTETSSILSFGNAFSIASDQIIEGIQQIRLSIGGQDIFELLTGGGTFQFRFPDFDASGLGAGASDLFSGFFDTLTEANQQLQPLVSSFGELTNSAVSSFLDFATTFTEGLSGLHLGISIVNFVSTFLDNITTAIESVDPSTLLAKTATFAERITDVIGDVLAATSLPNFRHSIGDLVSTLVGEIGQTLSNPEFASGLAQSFSHLVTGIITGASNILAGLTEGLERSGGLAGLLSSLDVFVNTFVHGVTRSLAQADFGELALQLGKNILQAGQAAILGGGQTVSGSLQERVAALRQRQEAGTITPDEEGQLAAFEKRLDYIKERTTAAFLEQAQESPLENVGKLWLARMQGILFEGENLFTGRSEAVDRKMREIFGRGEIFAPGRTVKDDQALAAVERVNTASLNTAQTAQGVSQASADAASLVAVNSELVRQANEAQAQGDLQRYAALQAQIGANQQLITALGQGAEVAQTQIVGAALASNRLVQSGLDLASAAGQAVTSLGLVTAAIRGLVFRTPLGAQLPALPLVDKRSIFERFPAPTRGVPASRLGATAEARAGGGGLVAAPLIPPEELIPAPPSFGEAASPAAQREAQVNALVAQRAARLSKGEEEGKLIDAKLADELAKQIESLNEELAKTRDDAKKRGDRERQRTADRQINTNEKLVDELRNGNEVTQTELGRIADNTGEVLGRAIDLVGSIQADTTKQAQQLGIPGATPDQARLLASLNEQIGRQRQEALAAGDTKLADAFSGQLLDNQKLITDLTTGTQVSTAQLIEAVLTSFDLLPEAAANAIASALPTDVAGQTSLLQSINENLTQERDTAKQAGNIEVADALANDILQNRELIRSLTDNNDATTVTQEQLLRSVEKSFDLLAPDPQGTAAAATTAATAAVTATQETTGPAGFAETASQIVNAATVTVTAQTVNLSGAVNSPTSNQPAFGASPVQEEPQQQVVNFFSDPSALAEFAGALAGAITTALPPLPWNLYVAQLIWSEYLPRLLWADFVPRIRWQDMVPRLAWSDYVQRLDFTSLVTPVDLRVFVTPVDLSDYVIPPPTLDPITSIGSLTGNIDTATISVASANVFIQGSVPAPGLAAGTSGWRGGRGIGGELGPELFVTPAGQSGIIGRFGPQQFRLPRGSVILPAHVTERVLGSNASLPPGAYMGAGIPRAAALGYAHPANRVTSYSSTTVNNYYAPTGDTSQYNLSVSSLRSSEHVESDFAIMAGMTR